MELLPLFYSVASEAREKYNKVIHDSSLPVSNELDWWAENVSSRNTYSCPLFHFICCIELIKELEKAEKKIQLILIDSIQEASSSGFWVATAPRGSACFARCAQSLPAIDLQN